MAVRGDVAESLAEGDEDESADEERLSRIDRETAALLVCSLESVGVVLTVTMLLDETTSEGRAVIDKTSVEDITRVASGDNELSVDGVSVKERAGVGVAPMVDTAESEGENVEIIRVLDVALPLPRSFVADAAAEKGPVDDAVAELVRDEEAEALAVWGRGVPEANRVGRGDMLKGSDGVTLADEEPHADKVPVPLPETSAVKLATRTDAAGDVDAVMLALAEVDAGAESKAVADTEKLSAAELVEDCVNVASGVDVEHDVCERTSVGGADSVAGAVSTGLAVL